MRTAIDTTILSILALIAALFPGKLYGQELGDPLIRYAGNHAVLTVAKVSERTFEVTLSPLPSITSNTPAPVPGSEILIDYPREVLFESRSIMDPFHQKVGDYIIDILRSPLRVVFRKHDGETIQEISWPGNADGRFEFRTASAAFRHWNHKNIDQRSRDDALNGYKIIAGANGWAMFVPHPKSLKNEYRFRGDGAFFIPDAEKSETPVQIFLILWDEPEQIFNEFRLIAGEAPVPPVYKEVNQEDP